jgi:hypothetical protein
MQAYSASQKKFIDIPDNGQNINTNQNPSINQNTTNNSDDQIAQLQQILGMMALKKGDITTAASLLIPKKTKTFAESSTTGDKTNLQTAWDTLALISRSQNELNKVKNQIPSGIFGALASKLSDTGIGSYLYTPEVRQTIGDLTKLQGMGDRSLIGGRMSGYLLKTLGVGFPQLTNSSKQNLYMLAQMKQDIANKLGSTADAYGLNSVDELPGSEIYSKYLQDNQ